MRVHYLKTLPEYFGDVASGAKPFEARKNDRDYQKGDTLVLLEWEPASIVEDDRDGYTGRWVERTVSYVLHGPGFGIEASHVVMGLAREEHTHGA